MKTVHIMQGSSSAEAREQAQSLDIVPGGVVSIMTAGSVIDGHLRGVSGEIIVHFDPEREFHDERVRREFMMQVQIAARDGLVIHARPRPVVVGSNTHAREQMRRRYFTAAGGPAPTDEQRNAVSQIQEAVVALAVAIEGTLSVARHRERALEDLEAVAMRAIRGIFAEGDR